MLKQLSLSSTITQSTASENHVKLSSLKPRYKARKKKTQRHGRERQNVFLVYARILGPCVTIFMKRVLMNHLHWNWRTLSIEAFLEPMEEYRLPCPLAQIPLEEDSAHLPVVSELYIARLLAKLNPSKLRRVDQMKYPIGYCGSNPNFSLTLYVV